MGEKISDKKKKQIIADYIECQNYSEVARKHKVSVNTVKNIVLKDKDTANKCKQKKEENTKDILEYMDSIYDKQKNIIDLSLSALEEKKDIATVYGVIFDKALKYKEIKNKNNEGSSADINNNIINISKLINNPVENRTEENMNE